MSAVCVFHGDGNLDTHNIANKLPPTRLSDIEDRKSPDVDVDHSVATNGDSIDGITTSTYDTYELLAKVVPRSTLDSTV